jgi:molybdopterin/thiamine biosynthesis adenylyltransferase
MDRFDRSIRFFGRDGQEKLRAATVVVMGCGGLGTHVGQQLALSGVGEIRAIDDEELDVTNKNRYVTARATDPVPGSPKVDLFERMIREIDPSIAVVKVNGPLLSLEAFDAIKTADYIFGCLDNEGSRLVLTELCAAYAKPYFDLASDIIPGDQPRYGGRVCVAWNGNGCPVCLDVIDLKEAQRELADPHVRKDMDDIYGVDRALLDQKGPSVVSINGVVASLGVMEFMVAATGIREPQRLLTYHGYRGIVTLSADAPSTNCYYCHGIRGKGAQAGVERFLFILSKKKTGTG